VIDTGTGTKLASDIEVGALPRAIAITPEGQRAYVVNDGDDDVSVIDTTTNTKLPSDIQVGNGPEAIAIAPNGERAYVPNFEDDDVSVIDTTTNTNLDADIRVGTRPRAIAITPSGERAYVSNLGDDDVSVIDTATNTNLGADIPVASFPAGIALTPDGLRAYVVSPNPFGVQQASVIDTTTNTALADDIPTGDLAFAVAITPDGQRAYVANAGDDDVSIIDTATNTSDPNDDIAVGNTPQGIAITPNQPPQAALSAARDSAAAANGETFVAEVGEEVSFDASASTDPDGEVATYAWDFGDGEQAVNGPAQAHAYNSPGTYTATLTLTDDEGCSTEFVFTGQTASCNGSDVAEATQKVKVLAAPKLKLQVKKKQKPDALKLKASCGKLPCEAKISGKAKLPREGRKTKSYKLKTKTVSLNEGKTKSVKLKFEKQKKSVRKIDKLLNKDKKARKRNKLTVKVKATGPAGGTDMGKAKIKLKG
jgi:YVTN family beta-propeller protein